LKENTPSTQKPHTSDEVWTAEDLGGTLSLAQQKEKAAAAAKEKATADEKKKS